MWEGKRPTVVIQFGKTDYIDEESNSKMELEYIVKPIKLEIFIIMMKLSNFFHINLNRSIAHLL